ncbi:EH domain-containing protein 2-like [Pezoporus wallicus]|uniref:EH domain-containing protein 2-like n=1 Tax=Pezoporus wallicus TaxID=35540 RepID=UPI00254A93F9|nr:EH domain-containing protein 2-like [Pezoporus wallicus]
MGWMDHPEPFPVFRHSQVHAHILARLRKEMPSVFGKEAKKKQLISQLPLLFARIQLEHHIPAGDFPDCARMQELLLVHDFSRFPALKPRVLEALDELLTSDIAALMPLLRREELEAPEGSGAVQGGAFDGARQGPFSAEEGGEGEDEEGEEDGEWAVLKDKAKYDEIFYGLAPTGGKLSGRRAKGWMVTSNLPSSVLGRIWKLSDVDRDGMLDDEEFALAGHLIGAKLEGRGLPADLPPRLVPPSKRRHKGSAE